MLYYNAMMPQYVVPYPCYTNVPKKTKKKKKKKLAYPVKWHRKKISLASYLKKVFCRAILKCLKKNTKNQPAVKQLNSKKKHQQLAHPCPHHPPQISIRRSTNGKKRDIRDYWGSKHGSEWLFGKAQAADKSHLLEIVDAFRTSDLKHSRLRQRIAPNYVARNEFCPQHGSRVADSHCPCGHPACQGHSRSKKLSKRNRRESAGSEWSLSTMQMDRRPYSRWPPSRPQKPSKGGAYNEPLSSVLSRMNMYLYNWVYVDQLKLNQSSARFVQSLGTLERYRQKLNGVKPGTRQRSSSRVSSVISVCSSKCCENKVKAVSSIDKYHRLQNRIRKKVI